MESFYLLNDKKDIILEHNWKSRSFRSTLEAFISERLKDDWKRDVLPVSDYSSCLIFHVKTGHITMICVASREVDSSFILELMHRLAVVFEDYFGAIAATTELIQNNADTVTELLCEVADNGFAMTTELNGIRDIVLPPSLLNKLMNVAGMQSKYEVQGQLSTIPWRRAKVKYTNNEIFVDVLEDVQAIVDKNGKLVSTDIRGNVQCTTKLSGNPEVTVVLKPIDAVTLPAYHQCVKRDKLAVSPSTLSFIPPDGTFSLLTYSSEVPANSSSPVPFSVQCIQGKSEDSFDIILSTRSGCPDPISLEIPLPASCRGVRMTATRGEYSLSKDSSLSSPILVRWIVSPATGKSAGAGSRTSMTCSGVPRGLNNVSFARALATMSGSAISGLKIDSLKMQRTGDWKPYKGVKYLTKLDMVFRTA